MFNIKDIVVHSVYGLCRIVDEGEETSEGIEKKLFVLEPLGSRSDKLRILIPKDEFSEKVRKPLKKDDIPKVMDKLSEEQEIIPEDVYGSYSKIKSKINSKDIYDIAEALNTIKNGNDGLLTVEKRKLLKSGMARMVSEISYVAGINASDAKKKINKALVS